MHIKKLQRLADGIKTVEQEIFNMWFLRSEKDDDEDVEVEFISPDNCGTIGCALGHAPLIWGLKPIRSDFYRFYGQRILDFEKYADRVFGLTDREWDWCFSKNWKSIDNTPKGAAERIEYLVKHGNPPKNFIED